MRPWRSPPHAARHLERGERKETGTCEHVHARDGTVRRELAIGLGRDLRAPLWGRLRHSQDDNRARANPLHLRDKVVRDEDAQHSGRDANRNQKRKDDANQDVRQAWHQSRRRG